MMPAVGPAVAFDGVSKRFRRGRRRRSLRELLTGAPRNAPRRGAGADEFWAVRDVSFAVGPGEALGIIGPNGAGKSTVLKLLAGILRPDGGTVTARGRNGGRARFGALIELAAGFQYDLTGRENVYLQGAVCGMPRSEIGRRFDEIVAFAEVEEFIDTPVKHYSSGMTARLGFSIAAHLDPDILIIDEVLAVGDLAFQQKAFARLTETVRRDVPAVVVSHQLHRIAELCARAILLTRGRVIAAGSPAECIAAYVGEEVDADHPDGSVRLLAISAAEPAHVLPGERLRLRVAGEVTDGERAAHVAVGVRVRALPREEIVFSTNSEACGVRLPRHGAFELEVDLAMNVAPGTYRAQAVAWDVRHNRETARGPVTLIAVGGVRAGGGAVFPDPRMRLVGAS